MIKDLLSKGVIILDGAMGTMLQANGLKIGEKPEILNLTNPKLIEEIHYKYLMAGADIIYTNTFGANPIKLANYDYKLIIKQAITLAKNAVKKAKKGFVAFDIGALGELIEPIGNMSFDMAYNVYSEIVNLAKNDVDLFVLETMSDLYELKAGVLAVKENCNLPVIVTMSFDENARTFAGCPIESMVLTMEGLGVDALGLNCSLGPIEIKNLVSKLVQIASVPVVLKPNAGLPIMLNGNTHYNVDAKTFAETMAQYVDLGASIVGGCCGTTDEYIKLLSEACKNKKVCLTQKSFSGVASNTNFVQFNQPRIVGERINPTGKKLMKEAILNNDIGYFQTQAIAQVEAGAEILDVNMGLPNIDEAQMMVTAIKAIQSIVDAPLQIDSSNPLVIERALRYYNGLALVNSVNGDDESLNSLLPIIKKYGACVVGLTLDKYGVPNSTEKRIEIAKKILNKALEFGISKDKIIIDCLTLTVGAQQEQAVETLNAIKYVKNILQLKTTLGVSNISFGLPERQLINRSFLTMALACGLDLPIINPNLDTMKEAMFAFRVLNGADKDAKKYIETYSNILPEQNNVKELSLCECIEKSLEKEAVTITYDSLKTINGLELIDAQVIPALNNVGEKYEKGTLFLPQLISSSNVAKSVCEVIKASLKNEQMKEKFTIVIATVQGDVHDIGKNIVKTVLQNYGYKIIDLGKDVPIAKVVEAVQRYKPKAVGLSALMTTTVANMKKTISAIRKLNT
ncbi:MAG: homocysteine S-methyltransferase family protein, partial [Clostridia bacterium]